MDTDAARARFADVRVARLSTIGPSGGPHIVPIVLTVVGDAIYCAVDHKPKRTTLLRRLANIEANPLVSVLADHYDEDWQSLWWVRADGRARILIAGDLEAEAALDGLVERYPQYQGRRPVGPVVAIDVTRWTAWAASPASPASPSMPTSWRRPPRSSI